MSVPSAARCRQPDRRLLAGLLLSLTAISCRAASIPCTPNILLVVIDTLRADSLSAYGYWRQTSPNIDGLAQEGVLFESATSVGSGTPPSMASLMTGRLPHYPPGGVWDESSPHGLDRFFRDGEVAGIPLSLDTLAEHFQRAGYQTAGIVTNAYVKRVFGFDQGFEQYQEVFRSGSRPQYGLAEQVSTRALAWLSQRDRRPFFLYLHYMDPHAPYLPPERLMEAFEFQPVLGHSARELNRKWSVTTNAESGASVLREHAKALYDASILYLDAEIGRLLRRLRREEMLEATIVALVGDHGEEFLEHGGTHHHGTFYEELVRVPLILRVPGVPARRISVPVRHFDLGPTLLELACVGGGTEEQDAVSLAGVILGGSSSPPPAAFTELPLLPENSFRAERPARQMLRTAHHKLIWHPREPDASELYDLEKDPEEKFNLHRQRPTVAARLKSELDRVLAKLEQERLALDAGEGQRSGGLKAAPPALDDETVEQLRALGYLE